MTTYLGAVGPALPVALQMPMDGSWGGWWLGILTMVVGALLLAAVVFAVVRLLSVPVLEGTELRVDGDDAVAVLRERFARGEIDEDEFERRMTALRRG